MRKWPLILILLAGTAVLATAQVMSSGGTATYGSPQMQGSPAYAPLITTPTADLSTSAPSPIGARNATPGLVAGATNSTLSSPAAGMGPVAATGQYSTEAAPTSLAEEYQTEAEMSGEVADQQPEAWLPPIMNVGPGGPPSAYNVQPDQPSLAQMAAESGMHKGPAGHVYTNEDIARIGQQSPPQMMNAAPGTDGISIVPLRPRSGQKNVGPQGQSPAPAPPGNQSEP